MKKTIEIINNILSEHPKAAIAFSGCGDSSVLLDIIFRYTDFKPFIVWADSKMEYPESRDFIVERAKHYNAELLIAEAPREPLEQWQRYGWAMHGKLAARLWQQDHKHFDFKCDVSTCCQKMKIDPARKLIKEQGCTLQLTGQRGSNDDRIRGMRQHLDGNTHFVKSCQLTICNPLTGWTDLMINRYTEQFKIPKHPAKNRGALTIGCMFCGGGAQFDNSGFKVLRNTNYEEWKKFIVDWKAGEIILAIKYDRFLKDIQEAIEICGGLEKLANDKPYIFDFIRKKPLNGYLR